MLPILVKLTSKNKNIYYTAELVRDEKEQF